MKVIFRIVGEIDDPDDQKVDLDVIPREGEQVDLPDPEYGGDGRERTVRTVVHFPLGGGLCEGPWVYIVLGSR